MRLLLFLKPWLLMLLLYWELDITHSSNSCISISQNTSDTSKNQPQNSSHNKLVNSNFTVLTNDKSIDKENCKKQKENGVEYQKLGESYETKSIPLFDLNIENISSNDHIYYSKNEKEDLIIYTAQKGYGFKKVIEKKNLRNFVFKDQVIWKSKNEIEYALKVILKGSGDKPKYLLIIPHMGNFILYHKEDKNCDWIDITSWRLSLSDFKFFGKCKSCPKVRELDSSNYKRLTYKFMFGYKFKDGVKCTKIMNKDTDLWKHTGNPNYPFPIGIYYDLIGKNLYALFQYLDKKLFYPLTVSKSELFKACSTYSKTTENSKNHSSSVVQNYIPFSNVNQFVSKSSEQDYLKILKNREDPSLSDSSLEKDFKIITLDPSDINKTNENDNSQYEIKDSDNFLIYNFKDDTKCVELKHGNRTLWKFDQNNNDTYPTSLFLFKTIFLFVLEISNNKFLLYGLTSDNNLESESFNGVSDISESSIKIITNDGTNLKVNDSTQYEFLRYDFGFQYKFKPNAECTELNYNGNTVWKYNPNDHDRYPFLVYIMSCNVLIFPKDYDKLKCSNKIKMVELDIKSKKSTDEYEFVKNDQNNTGIYTPKQGYGFSKVLLKNDWHNEWCKFRTTNILVWKSENEIEYATKVFFTSKFKKVIVTLADESNINYKKIFET